jgi:hypothetical protein
MKASACSVGAFSQWASSKGGGRGRARSQVTQERQRPEAHEVVAVLAPVIHELG